ncbi:hypothetical protein ACFL01_01395, partial [Planctomycetota bacterium]
HEKADLFSRAKKAFSEGNALRAQKPLAARQEYARAASLFERIAREGGVRNGKLYYNIGNAYFLNDQMGQAILCYRKAERLIPRHDDLTRNLSAARMRRKDKIEVETRTKAMEILFFWHYDFSLRARFILCVLFLEAILALAILSLLKPQRRNHWPMATAAVLCLGLAASVLVEEYSRITAREGVITTGEIVARKGDGEAYSPSFKAPLHEGTEFLVLEERGTWLHVRLTDGRTCWIPLAAAGLI